MELHCPGVYFDGTSSQRHDVTVRIGEAVQIISDATITAVWPFETLRMLDAQPGEMKLRSLLAPDLASLTLADPEAIAFLKQRATRLGYEGERKRSGTLKIVVLSLAAAVSIIAVTIFGIPRMARAVADVMPVWAERKLGDAAAGQVQAMFGGQVCTASAGTAALNRLTERLTREAGLPYPVRMGVLKTVTPNAIALPGGQVWLFQGLLAKAESPDEIAGVLGHEIGHQAHRDSMKGMIEAGGTAFLLGLLFGDVGGSSAVIFATRQAIDAAHSRDAETAADLFAQRLMHRLGRPAAPMARILTRIDPAKPGEKGSLFASHPVTAERLQRLEAADSKPPRALDGPPLLEAGAWNDLKSICETG